MIYPTQGQEIPTSYCPDTRVNRMAIRNSDKNQSLQDYVAEVEAAWDGLPITEGFAIGLQEPDDSQIVGVDTYFLPSNISSDWTMEIISLATSQYKFTVFVNEQPLQAVFEGEQSSAYLELPSRQLVNLSFTLPSFAVGIYDVVVIGHRLNQTSLGDTDILSRRFTLVVGEAEDELPRTFVPLTQAPEQFLSLQERIAYIGVAQTDGSLWSDDTQLAQTDEPFEMTLVIPYALPMSSVAEPEINRIGVLLFDNGEYLGSQYVEIGEEQGLGTVMWQYPLPVATEGIHNLVAIRIADPGLVLCTVADIEPLMGYGIEFEVIP